MLHRIIAKGAGGGQGSEGTESSKGAEAIVVTELNKTQNLFILVGHLGGNACRKVNSVLSLTYKRLNDKGCTNTHRYLHVSELCIYYSALRILKTAASQINEHHQRPHQCGVC